MKRITLAIVAAFVASPFFAAGCGETVSHTEKDTPNMSGGRTHTEKTVTKNPDGTYTTEQEKTKTNP